MGIVTAAYALGAAVSPPLFALAVDGGGYQMAMIGLAAALIILGGLSAVLLASSGAHFLSRPADASSNKSRISDLSLLWIGYGAGVAGGLMVIGHAAGLLAAADTSTPYWAAPVLIAVCNLTGSLVAGWMIDRVSQGALLIGLPLLSAAALLVLSGSFQEATLIIGLGVVGFAYGGIIAAYPAAIAKFFGMLDSPRIYGRVFTAWGAAGLAAPWLAGFLYDLDGAYFVALTTAGALGCVSSLAAVVFFLRRHPR